MAGPRRRRERRGQRGASAVEFALVVPVLLLLLLGIISYGFMLSLRQAVTQAAAEGARAAAVTLVLAEKQANGRTAVSNSLDTYGITCSAGNLVRAGDTVGTCDVTAPGACVPAAATGVQCVKVTVSYNYGDHPLIPTFPGVGVVLPDTLSYSAQARVS
ncbi:MAG: TadE family protein [Nocardioides sp.]|nr:TadE family protein [Nocardioides sp.]